MSDDLKIRGVIVPRRTPDYVVSADALDDAATNARRAGWVMLATPGKPRRRVRVSDVEVTDLGVVATLHCDEPQPPIRPGRDVTFSIRGCEDDEP